jgi:hypothetical protein
MPNNWWDCWKSLTMETIVYRQRTKPNNWKSVWRQESPLQCSFSHFSFLLAYINCPKGFHCDISTHAYTVLWSNSLLLLFLISIVCLCLPCRKSPSTGLKIQDCNHLLSCVCLMLLYVVLEGRTELYLHKITTFIGLVCRLGSNHDITTYNLEWPSRPLYGLVSS